MTCHNIRRSLEAFVDGELPPARMLDVEQHVAECTLCLERVQLADSLRRSLQRAVRQDAVPSDAFRARIAATVAAERSREGASARGPKSTAFDWKTVAPLAAAAALALMFSSAIRDRNADRAERAEQPSASPLLASASSVEQLLDQLVDYHQKPPDPQITEPSLVPHLEPEVGVPVHIPELGQYGARWEGGSVVPVRNQAAAVLRYRVSDRPVTIYVYNSRRTPLRGVLEPRVVRDMAVHVGERRGYSIAAMEQRGVGYAVATDLDGNESAELVASLH